ncbi:MAG: FAD-binding and (Fe-S)-binding domain-containing protein [Bacteroidia bacterium]
MKKKLKILRASLDGELFFDHTMRALYATDASVYRELPLAVAMPRNLDDLKQLIHFATKEGTSLIPRTAGTSLAGQCVGSGIVVDVSKYFTEILEVNAEEGWVRVQPGVVRDELNLFLKPHGLFFGPNTSTSNRAMIGGMVGNNSCGSYSIVYGTTRDHILALHAVLSDGSEVVFAERSPAEFAAKCEQSDLEGQLYRHLREELSQPVQQDEIRAQFPDASIHRRNTGYAVDILLESNAFTAAGPNFDMCKLIAGSEGTLAFMTEIKLHCDPLPPDNTGLICVHFESVDASLKAVIEAMKFEPRAVELMDKIVMDCTKENLLYQNDRFFIEGDPEAVLVIEVGGETEAKIAAKLDDIQSAMQQAGMGYAFPRVFGADRIKKVWALRSAGLGLLANIPGDAKPVAVIEDTAVPLPELPAYIREFADIMEGFDQRAVYYAHAGAGELHLRPILDLKKSRDRKHFREIGQASAELVKKYKGSLSGEHGDGRVRAEFLPIMIGDRNYALLNRLKNQWDPNHIFNPGKIVDAPPMDVSLRYELDQPTKKFDTVLDFSDTDGILRAAEKCNGSGDCRKTHLFGGTMCPSYQATRSEKETTRARANILREILTRSEDANPFASEEIKEVMDLCLSCKGCASECPSNVNVALLKTEFQYQYHKKHGVPLRTRAIANISRLNRLAMIWPSLSNLMLKRVSILKTMMGVAPERSLPLLHKQSLKSWCRQNRSRLAKGPKGKVYFFADEFTNFNDVPIGIKAIELLNRLGYAVILPEHVESGRAYLSKGLLDEAKKLAIKNVSLLKDIVSEETPLLGLEPSGILSFRDEYPRLVAEQDREAAKALGKQAIMVEEFLMREVAAGRIDANAFTDAPRQVKLHGHCHQKALSSVAFSEELLSLPTNYEVSVMPSGCCGMAGSFGYEKEHYPLSMQIGELVVFPEVRSAAENTIIAAPGTSCRHQIHDGTGKSAKHPVEVLWEALL